jgi:hypothetical protein
MVRHKEDSPGLCSLSSASRRTPCAKKQAMDESERILRSRFSFESPAEEACLERDVKPSGHHPLIAHLAALSKRLTDAHSNVLNLDNSALIRQYCAKDFVLVSAEEETGHRHQIVSGDIEQHIKLFSMFKKIHPSFHTRAISATGALRSSSSKNAFDEATVWVTAQGSLTICKHAHLLSAWSTTCQCDRINKVTHHRESVNLLQWRNQPDDGKWVCYSWFAMRHCGWLPG